MTDKEKIDIVLIMISNYGQIDGDHHKLWLLNEIVKNLADDYDAWIKEYCEDGMYNWDTGIAP